MAETETTDRWVRVMADFSSDGFWQKDGCMMSREDLPISSILMLRHEAWCEWYDLHCEDYKPIEERTKQFDNKAFGKEGLLVAQAIKAELPDWTVIYFDESRINRDLPFGQQDRAEFEYEVAL